MYSLFERIWGNGVIDLQAPMYHDWLLPRRCLESCPEACSPNVPEIWAQLSGRLLAYLKFSNIFASKSSSAIADGKVTLP